ncbi:desampylase [Haloarchaeobius sp. DFWS5]|uniref:desampylase n=1 Tax=Haloarchaeobius sp. DFWS5 TaxID=3446114 RepID=UPI003EBE0BC4
MQFADDTRERLLELARDGTPDEICGVLAGRESPERIVTSVHPVTNVAETPETRYELDPEETLRVIEAVEESGDEVVGFYHSHPAGPDGPSETDHELATWPEKVYCIVSLAAEPQVGCWLWTGESFEPLAE